MGTASVLLRYGTKALKLAPEAILGTGSEVAAKAMRTKTGSIFAKAEAGVRALEKDVAKKSAQGGFFSRLWGNVKSLVPDVFYRGPKLGIRAAKIAGKNTFLGGLKGLGKAVVKKMPFIGAIATVAFEIPNIIETAKDKGILAAAGETLKTSARLAGGAAGAAIGSAICPGVGSLVGWVVGEWLAGKVVGKSYSEQKEEAQEAQGQQEVQPQHYSAEQISNLKALGVTDEEISQAQTNGYTYEEALKVVQEETKQVQPQAPVVSAPQVQTPQHAEVIPPVQDETVPQIAANESSVLDPFNNQYSPINLTSGLNNNYSLNPMYSNSFAQNSIFTNNQSNPYQPANLYNNDMLYQRTFGAISPNQENQLNQNNQYFQYLR